MSPKGALSIGEAKETAYAVYITLDDTTADCFAKVRKPIQLAA